MEGITKKQKRYLIKWTVIAGIICGVISVIVLLISGGGNWKESSFWLQTIVMSMGGGYMCGFLPAVLAEYRKTANE